MHIARKKKIVILGMMSIMPVAGNIWLVLHYLIGLRLLGYDAYYVEAHGSTPRTLMRHPDDEVSEIAAKFIDGVLRPFDLGNCWAFHAIYDGCCFGMSNTQLLNLYREADLIINLHGGTIPLPEHSATGRLVFLETDPVQLEIELFNDDQRAIAFLEPHVAFFTWGENYGNPDCKVPRCNRFPFQPTRAPVVLDLWQNGRITGGEKFTTVGNWTQQYREVTFQGERFYWSKHFEFLKFLDLPRRVDQSFELALSSYRPSDRQLLEENGWQVRHAMDFSADPFAYREYLCASRGEFTVAKDQNIRLRSGWFSERSAQYLAGGRPVITQATGFENVLPTGEGLFAFTTIDDIVAAIEVVNSDYPRHCRAATRIAQDWFNYDVVLKPMLEAMGV